MKYKITLVLICLLFIPSIARAYYSSEQFRTDIINSIGENQKRQQIQDIFDDQNRYNNQALDSYYRQIDSLQVENDFKLKQLQADIDARERKEAWQKEKQLLDGQLQMTNENKKLQEEINKLKAEEETRKIIEEALDASGKIEAPEAQEPRKNMFDDVFNDSNSNKVDVKPKHNSIFTNYDSTTDSVINQTTTPQITPTEPTTPAVTPTKKNVFVNLFDKFINLFK